MLIPTVLAAKQYIVEMGGQFKLPSNVKTVYKFKTTPTVVIASDESLEYLSNLKGVKNIWEDLIIAAPKPDITVPNFANISVNNQIHELTGVKELHDQGFIGKGAKVGIIDTGLDYNHPAFGSCFKTPGCKVISGYDFTGDDGTLEDEDPVDNCQEHGTHVGGIVAGLDEKFTGVAPGAQLGAYKVFPCTNGARESIIMRAMEQAYHDGMDIINMSLGSWSGWDNRPYCKFIDRLSELGLIVIISQGNEGSDGLFMGGSPAIAKSAISVASFNNKIFMNYQKLQAGSLSTNAEVVKEGTGTFKLALSSQQEIGNDGCSPYEVEFDGAAVLIKRGACALADKINNAINAGAGLVLLYNLADGPFSTGYQDESFKTGVYLLNGLDGQALRKTPGASITVTSSKSQQISTSSGLPSDFSSYGPGSTLQMKPEAAGIGGAVFSALPLNQGKYGILSGTSMSAPYISGVCALYIGKYGKTDPFKMKQLLMNNGQISSNNGVYPVVKQGAGLVNATNVLFNRVSASPPKLELGDQKWYSFLKHKSIVIKNDHSKPVTFKLKHIPALSVTGKDFGKITTKDTYAKILMSSTITVSAKSSKQFSINIMPPWLPNKQQWVYSGFIQMTPQGTQGATTINVPYMGYKGALKDTSILGNDGKFPNVITSGHLEDPFSGYHKASDVITADFTANGTIVFQLRVFQATPLLTIELYNAVTNKKMGYVYQQQGIGRTYSAYDPSSPSKYLVQVPWLFGNCVACWTPSLDAGKVKWRAAEDGEYYVKIVVDKPFEDGKESYTSPRIYVNRSE